MNFIKRAWLWLITKHQKDITVNESLSDVVSGQDAAITPAPAVSTIPATAVAPSAEVKDGVQDFEAAMNFVVDGVEKLGDAAKDELVALAKKYL